MKTLPQITDAIGKTVKYAYLCGEKLLISFEDKTFLILESSNGYDGCDSSIREVDIGFEYFPDEIMVKSGLSTQAEIDKERKARSDESAALQLRYKQHQFERLKKELQELTEKACQ